MEEFEKLISFLEDYEIVNVPIVVNTSISAGEYYEEHNVGCRCDKRILVFTLTPSDPEKEPIRFAVPVSSPLGQALTSDAMRSRCLERLDELS